MQIVIEENHFQISHLFLTKLETEQSEFDYSNGLCKTMTFYRENMLTLHRFIHDKGEVELTE